MVINTIKTLVFFLIFCLSQRVAFHPNCNYVATGSCDRTVRFWDLNTGSSVRFFTGHKVTVDKYTTAQVSDLSWAEFLEVSQERTALNTMTTDWFKGNLYSIVSG